MLKTKQIFFYIIFFASLSVSSIFGNHILGIAIDNLDIKTVKQLLSKDSVAKIYLDSDTKKQLLTQIDKIITKNLWYKQYIALAKFGFGSSLLFNHFCAYFFSYNQIWVKNWKEIQDDTAKFLKAIKFQVTHSQINKCMCGLLSVEYLLAAYCSVTGFKTLKKSIQDYLKALEIKALINNI